MIPGGISTTHIVMETSPRGLTPSALVGEEVLDLIACQRRSGYPYSGYLNLLTTERAHVASFLLGEESFVGNGVRGFLTGLDVTCLIPSAVLHLLCLKHR